MFIVINCLGMPFNGNTIKERSLGGSETAAIYVARELAALGHKVTVFTTLKEQELEVDGVKYVWAGEQTSHSPMGEHFDFFAENTPHDVLIIQRNPFAFAKKYASKLNLWWLHDLATVSMRDHIASHLWNIDGFLVVSEFHKQQICDVWNIDEEFVHIVRNGVDIELFERSFSYELPNPRKYSLLYTSRPERGLDHLVADSGIMDRLGDDYHLFVCGYDNDTPAMAGLYNHLRRQCEKKSNVTDIGSLTKQDLANVMCQCDALVYPTPSPQAPNFEEVSCITAMEAMAARLPFISSEVGALPETCKDSGSILIPLKDGKVDLDSFVKSIRQFADSEQLRDMQHEARKNIGWERTATAIETLIEGLFSRLSESSALATRFEMLRNSDIYALTAEVEKNHPVDYLSSAVMYELDHCYNFAFSGPAGFEKHYKEYYDYEKERGIDYGPESLDGNTRFEYVSSLISNLDVGSMVLDYGCAHGHYTINLAKRFPELRFEGYDLAQTNIDKAKSWAKKDGLSNVAFYRYDMLGENEFEKRITVSDTEHQSEEASALALENYAFDAIIAAEVLEHVDDPVSYVEALTERLRDGGLMIITTPFGPWEASGYDKHYPWRAHLWHFERGDLHYLWGDRKNFKITVAPSGRSQEGDVLGSYITTFTHETNRAFNTTNYESMFERKRYASRQTVSVCMIVKDGEENLLRCLNSVKGIATEIIIGVDKTTTDGTNSVIERFGHSFRRSIPDIDYFVIESPVKTGFDEARNEVIRKASCDWILWIDHDEELLYSENLHKYLRNNMFKGYAVKQHHMSADPLGCLRTDFPCRLFRNNEGIHFVGRVHEHPEVALNEGVGRTCMLPDVEIIHDGYTTTDIRKKRFLRNIPLMHRDREDYPDRALGKFLWIRDLAQMIMNEIEINGGVITNTMEDMADEGLELWKQLLADNHLRLVIDSMEYYHVLAQLKGGKEYFLSFDTSAFGEVDPKQADLFKGHFASTEHVNLLFQHLMSEKTKEFDSRYLR